MHSHPDKSLLLYKVISKHFQSKTKFVTKN